MIDLAHIRRVVGDAHGTVALSDATCRIVRGEFVAILGASGSGKTTLLSLLGLLDHPTSGTYLFDGQDVESLSEEQRNDLRGSRIGFVFQNSYLIAEDSVAENVALGLRVRGVPREERSRLVDEVLGHVGLAGFQDRVAGELSGGEKQRVALARALVGGPDVVMADEPTGALDSDSTHRLVELLRDVNLGGTTIVVVTHDPIVAEAADRVIEIVDGVVASGESSSSAMDPAAGQRAAAIRVERRTKLWQEVIDAAMTPLARPLRAALVMLAYILGVAALVGAVGLTQSTTAQIVYRLTEAGSNEIRVTTPSTADWGYSLDFANIDAEVATISALEGVDTAVAVRTFAPQSNLISRVRVSALEATGFSGRIFVTDASYLRAYGLRAVSGNVVNLTNDWNGPVVAVGSRAAEKLGVTSVVPGVSIWVNGISVDVIAVLAPTGDVLADDAVYFSRACLPMLPGPVDSYLLVLTGKGYAEPLARALPLALSPENPGSIHTSTVAQLANLQQGINSDLTSLLGVIGWVILALSTLAAGTTMYLSVQQRAPEIALRRAMGADRASIFRLFTYEGVAVGVTGGIVGQIIGIAIAWIVANANSWPLSLGLGTGLLGLAVGFVAGAVASMLPAGIAARQDPALILRTI
ncbi:MAG: ATP-binding cassette domain-containing protein [Propionibacteriaceae bacterium]|jgi:macrolide transport system ATP-binding/permease protein|nr:ATP-binding cassette domain-containing protein [Propionibacteriaceae bacterium]